MPTYEYYCKPCDLLIDVRHHHNDTPQIECPKCHAVMKRQISRIGGIQFKGSGFYETDYKRKKP